MPQPQTLPHKHVDAEKRCDSHKHLPVIVGYQWQAPAGKFAQPWGPQSPFTTHPGAQQLTEPSWPADADNRKFNPRRHQSCAVQSQGGSACIWSPPKPVSRHALAIKVKITPAMRPHSSTRERPARSCRPHGQVRITCHMQSLGVSAAAWALVTVATVQPEFLGPLHAGGGRFCHSQSITCGSCPLLACFWAHNTA